MPESLDYAGENHRTTILTALTEIADFYEGRFDTERDDGYAGIDLNKIAGYTKLEEAILKLHKCTKKGGKKSRNSRKSRKSRK